MMVCLVKGEYAFDQVSQKKQTACINPIQTTMSNTSCRDSGLVGAL